MTPPSDDTPVAIVTRPEDYNLRSSSGGVGGSESSSRRSQPFGPALSATAATAAAAASAVAINAAQPLTSHHHSPPLSLSFPYSLLLPFSPYIYLFLSPSLSLLLLSAILLFPLPYHTSRRTPSSPYPFVHVYSRRLLRTRPLTPPPRVSGVRTR